MDRVCMLAGQHRQPANGAAGEAQGRSRRRRGRRRAASEASEETAEISEGELLERLVQTQVGRRLHLLQGGGWCTTGLCCDLHWLSLHACTHLHWCCTAARLGCGVACMATRVQPVQLGAA